MADLDALIAATAELGRLAAEGERVARARRDEVRRLLASGWSLQRIADGLGVSKTAVAKMRRPTHSAT